MRANVVINLDMRNECMIKQNKRQEKKNETKQSISDEDKTMQGKAKTRREKTEQTNKEQTKIDSPRLVLDKKSKHKTGQRRSQNADVLRLLLSNFRQLEDLVIKSGKEAREDDKTKHNKKQDKTRQDRTR
jgi:hypothetical protein